jgi:hypothetical protein
MNRSLVDADFRDYTVFLWLLKLGALVNLYLLAYTPAPFAVGVDPYLVLPAQIFFVVSFYRCLFPVRYEHNVVFHDSVFSSIFATRLVATIAEVAYIYQFSRVLRRLNVEQVGWVDGLSWLMVATAAMSQAFVWAAILTGRLELYFVEELGWLLIFIANTAGAAYLYLTTDVLGGREALLVTSLVFGAGYLPFQIVHLRGLRAAAATGSNSAQARRLAEGLPQSIRLKNRRTDAAAWGGRVGLLWMTGYWATLIPVWMYCNIVVFSAR